MSFLLDLSVFAQKSYIYLELIKNIPCKVKQNGVEMTQYNKNYILLYGDHHSEQKIDIEFGADLYPKQTFIIDMSPNNAFAYKLSKSNETSFYLIDLINNGKVVESNSNTNIGFATASNQIYFSDNTPSSIVNNTTATKEKLISKSKKTKHKEAELSETTETPAYGVIEVLRNESNPESKTKNEELKKENKLPVEANPQTPKKGCNFIATTPVIDNFLQKLKAKKAEDDKLILLRRNQIKGCLLQGQITTITSHFSSQYARFEALKILSLQAAYPNQLIEAESLLKSQVYKSKFAEFVSNLNF
ncbi:MAG TPA: hypothetical protein PKA54_02995 [Chitinophagaceae bacterium]|nr:hypothetical protein [Chitinophagaceae bacterium]